MSRELRAKEHELTLPHARPRRTRVKGRRGIYYSLLSNGSRRYEYTFLDSTGRRRWVTVEGGLKEAEAALEEVRGRRRRGEAIAPTKARLSEVASTWLAMQTQLRPRTRAGYESSLRIHVLPRLGHLRLAEITEDDLALLIADLHARGYASWTIRSVLKPLGRILAYAARRGLISSSPMRRLERGELPSVGRREMRILSRKQIASLQKAAAPAYRALLLTATFTGLRQGELLGLVWRDIDFAAGVIRVRKSLDRDGRRTEPKTAQAIRDVVLMPSLAQVLREHRLASAYSSESDFVFASATGTPMNHRNVSRRGLERAVKAAALDGSDQPKFCFHDLRHTFTSLLIAQGANVVFVSRQLGHASPDITLKVYAHLFDQAEHASRVSALLESGFAAIFAASARKGGQPGGHP